MNDKIRVILVDDHQLFRLGLRGAIETPGSEIEIVGEAGSGKEFFELLPTVKSDIVLLDISLPDISGIDIAKRLHTENPELKILVLSAETGEDTIVQLTQTGINGFVSKSVPVEELHRAIEYVADGAEYYGRDISKLIHYIHVARENGKNDFTTRENDIIAMCAEGLSAKEIADKLNIGLSTVNTHKNNIFKKLGINNSVELVRYALKKGIIKL